ncbi:MAG: hypothetical protein ACR2JB_04050 [Bryobacteraceae bacterium]
MSSASSPAPRLEKIKLENVLHVAGDCKLEDKPVMTANNERVLKTFVHDRSVISCPRKECGAVGNRIQSVKQEDLDIFLYACTSGHFFTLTLGKVSYQGRRFMGHCRSAAPVEPIVMAI